MQSRLALVDSRRAVFRRSSGKAAAHELRMILNPTKQANASSMMISPIVPGVRYIFEMIADNEGFAGEGGSAGSIMTA